VSRIGQKAAQVHDDCGYAEAYGTRQTLWHFDKVLSRARAPSGAAKARFDALVQGTGGESVMALTLARPLKRENYVLVVA